MRFNQESAQDTRQNIAWINNLRLIAMFAVVVLHTASPLLFYHKGNPIQDWLIADIYNALVRFAVPVFVMITGALLLHRDYELGGTPVAAGTFLPPSVFSNDDLARLNQLAEKHGQKLYPPDYLD